MARLTEDQITEINALRNNCVSYRKTAISLGISIDTVKSHCRRHKIMPIRSSSSNDVKKKDRIRSSRIYKCWKQETPEPVCEVSVSYSSHDTDALPFLLETLASLFSGR